MSQLERIEALQRECDGWEKKYAKVTDYMYRDIMKLRGQLRMEWKIHKENIELRNKLFREMKEQRERADKLEASLKAASDLSQTWSRKWYALRDKATVAKELLEIWNEAPFFETEEEWDAWVTPLVPRIEKCIESLGLEQC